MKITKIKSPLKLLIAIGDRGSAEEIELYLNKHKLNGGLVLMGKGTAESEIADIFGFGMSDKDIIVCLIPENKSQKIVSDINEITGVEKDKYGLNMVLNLQSASSNLLDFLNIKLG